uniref:Uncharacterized protein n=1 Tax=Lepeophtheirus salmonis TaxID=72036 RepID=A0A0K2T4X0_LEPSM
MTILKVNDRMFISM